MEKYSCLDIMVPVAHLHREMNGEFFPRMHEIPLPPSYPMNDFIPHYRRNIPRVIPYEQQIEGDDDQEEPDTFFVNMKIDSGEEEQPETRLINLFIRTK